jgi:hypothetical protein
MNNTTIKNPIIAGYISHFGKVNELSNRILKDQHLVFEKYINEMVMTLYSFGTGKDYEFMDTGTAMGIDGIAFLINGKMCHNIEDVNFFVDNSPAIEVEFIFIQTKSKEKFIRTQINDFLKAIYVFFDFEAKKCPIIELQENWEIMKHIYMFSAKFKKNPKLTMLYVTLSSTEINLNDTHLKIDICKGINDLKLTDLFLSEDVAINFWSIKDVMKNHSKRNLKNQVTLSLNPQMIPYSVENKYIKSAYYGLISIQNFYKILVDEETKVIRVGIFESNVRDFLGLRKDGPNVQMALQLSSGDSELFGILNNGITIIADDIKSVGTNFTLINYQIVNGCQTSNVIYENYSKVEQKDIFIPIRIIASSDGETTNNIIKASNSQTEMGEEQLFSLLPIHKNIEEMYKAKMMENHEKLYYERRTNQYRLDEDVKISRVINIPLQIKASATMFLSLPHAVSGNYGRVVSDIEENDLFNEDGGSAKHYVSGLCFYKVDRYIRNYDKSIHRLRWHIMYTISKMYNKEYGKNFIAILEKELLLDANNVISKAIHLVISFIEDVNNKDYAAAITSDRKMFERKSTTDELDNFLNEILTSKKTINKKCTPMIEQLTLF